MEPGKTIAELLGEDVPSCAGPLAKFYKRWTGRLRDPEQGVQPASGPVLGEQTQWVQQQKRAEFQEQDQGTDAQPQHECQSVDLHFGKRPFL